MCNIDGKQDRTLKTKGNTGMMISLWTEKKGRKDLCWWESDGALHRVNWGNWQRGSGRENRKLGLVMGDKDGVSEVPGKHSDEIEERDLC